MNRNELKAVVEKAQNGERTAFEKLYKEFHGKLYFFVLKNVGDKHTAEDITEDSFLASMEGIGSLKEPEHYETWLHSIAFNKCRMYFRQKGREDNISLDDENVSKDIHADDTVMLPEDYADSKELKRSLKKVIEGLKPEQRSAVILYYYDGMPLKKVSEILEISENTAKQKLFKARAKIKKEIERIFEGGALVAVPVSAMIRAALPKKYAMTAASPVTAVKTSSTAVKIVGTAAAVVVAVSIPLALRGVNNNGFGVHDDSSVSDSFNDDSLALSDSSFADTSSEKIPDSSVSKAETDSIPEPSIEPEKVTDAAVTTAPVQTDTPVTYTQGENTNTVLPSADYPGEELFSNTVGDMLKMADNNYELVYPTFVQNGYDSMYQCSAFPQYHFGRAALNTETGKGYVDESLPVTRVELYNGAYITKDIYVGMTYNELCNALGEKPLMYLSNTDRNRIVSAKINGRTWWFGFDLTDGQLDETYQRMQAQTDSETFNLNPYQYGVDISDIDPVTNVAVCDISGN